MGRHGCATEARRYAFYTALAEAANESCHSATNSCIAARLEALLQGRSTLCHTNEGCSVAQLNATSLRVCLPPPRHESRLCELTMQARSARIKKVCLRRHNVSCMLLNTGEVLEWVSRLRAVANKLRRHPTSVPMALRQKAPACAVVMSGHSLRCGEPAGRRIDSEYDAVLRANFFASHRGDRAGSRCDVPFTSRKDRCRQIAALPNSCLDPHLLKEAYIPPEALGKGHSGSYVLSVAMAFCKHPVAVYGMGLWRAPNADLIYQHHDDELLARGCQPPNLTSPGWPCYNGDDARWLEERNWHKENADKACTPNKFCIQRYHGLHKRKYGLSNAPDDFFYMSELRLHVLHALGLIDWNWYHMRSHTAVPREPV